jgi:hypothetical protein
MTARALASNGESEMSGIRVFKVEKPTDPVIMNLADILIKTAQLSAEKATGHLVDPASYPMPAKEDALENIMLRQFSRLGRKAQRKLTQTTFPKLQLPSDERYKLYGSLASVNYQLSVPISDQIRVLRPLLEKELAAAQIKDMEIFPNLHINDFADPSSGNQSTPMYNYLINQIRKVTCIDETNEGIWGEIGKDEIHLAGAVTDDQGNIFGVKRFKVGDFDDGTVKEYEPAKEFVRFDLTANNIWPKVFTVSYLLAEVDDGGFDEIAKAIILALAEKGKEILEEYVDEIASVIGMAIGGAIGNVVGAAIGAALGWAIGKIIGLIDLGDFSDEVFEPYSIAIVVPSGDASWNTTTPSKSDLSIASFKGHGGEYELTYFWQLKKREPSLRIVGDTSVKYKSHDVFGRASFQAVASEFKGTVSYDWRVTPVCRMSGQHRNYVSLDNLIEGVYNLSVTASSDGESRDASVVVTVNKVVDQDPRDPK